jgi:nucleotide-binding universal stress UspA family protein
VRASGIKRVETQVLCGIASEVISMVAGGGYDLVVLTSYGSTPVGEAPIGSVAAQVLDTTTLPTLLVSPHYPVLDSNNPTLPTRRILVPLDGSEQAAKAIPIAVNLARAANATLILLGVTPHTTRPPENMVISQAVDGNAVLTEIVPLGETEDSSMVKVRQASNSYRYLSETARHFIPQGITYGIVETSGSPTHTILANAARMNCDLIVMTTHGYPSAAASLLSEVAWEVGSQATVPVLILREKGSAGALVQSHLPLRPTA